MKSLNQNQYSFGSGSVNTCSVCGAYNDYLKGFQPPKGLKPIHKWNHRNEDELGITAW